MPARFVPIPEGPLLVVNLSPPPGCVVCAAAPFVGYPTLHAGPASASHPGIDRQHCMHPGQGGFQEALRCSFLRLILLSPYHISHLEAEAQQRRQSSPVVFCGFGSIETGNGSCPTTITGIPAKIEGWATHIVCEVAMDAVGWPPAIQLSGMFCGLSMNPRLPPRPMLSHLCAVPRTKSKFQYCRHRVRVIL